MYLSSIQGMIETNFDVEFCVGEWQKIRLNKVKQLEVPSGEPKKQISEK